MVLSNLLLSIYLHEQFQLFLFPNRLHFREVNRADEDHLSFIFAMFISSKLPPIGKIEISGLTGAALKSVSLRSAKAAITTIRNQATTSKQTKGVYRL